MSKLQRLRNNIAAIEYAMTGNGDARVLDGFTGFGGLGFVLNPLDRKAWTKSDLVCYDDTVRMYDMLRRELSDSDYKQMVQSIKESVLTAFYTPDEVVLAIFKAMIQPKWDGGKFMPDAILDPAAGATGVFMDNAMFRCNLYAHNHECVAYEKDLLSGMILSRLYGNEDAIRHLYGRNYSGRPADVRVKGFETIPASELGKYDLVSTNVPFGDIAVFDPEYIGSKSAVRRAAAKMIHRYYVLKGLDCLRDGGIEAYIITSNYLNRDGDQLAEALNVSRLIGAYRLANNLFKESGTEVGTDLLVLQKDARKQGLTADESLLLTTYEDGGCPTNMYFECHPNHVIATDKERDTDAYGKPGFVYSHKDGVRGIAADVEKVLREDLAQNLFVRRQSNSDKREKRSANGESRESGKERLLKGILDGYNALYEYEQKEQTDNTELRKTLNERYDYFVHHYGYLNADKNKKAVERVSEELLALEVRVGNGWQKADIFEKPVAFSTEDLRMAGTPQEALAQSLNDYGRPDMQYMAAMIGMTEDEIADALGDEVFFDPINGEWVVKAKFISGNVIEKIDKIKSLYPDIDNPSSQDGGVLASSQVERHVRKSLAALEAAVPEPIPFEELDFNLGERWIDTKLYSAFASEFFSMPEDENPYSSGKVLVTVQYDSVLDQYSASCDRRNQKIYTQYRVYSECSKELDGMDLLQHALLNTCPKMQKYKRDDKGRCLRNSKNEPQKTEDHEKTQLANTKIEEIRQGWSEWLMRQSKELQQELADIYNRRFNCFVKPKFDGSHQTFPDVDWQGLEKKFGIPVPTVDADGNAHGGLYQSQKDCIWMLICNGGGICDHEVGSGKTLIMCIAAHEMHRLGLVHKPMIIGLKANVSAIAETYRTAYPNAKILYAGAKDYCAKERTAFFNNMKNNDYDCVIMSHDQFGRIPQSADIQLDVLLDEMQQLEDALNVIRDWDWCNQARVRKGLERRKKNLGVKIQALQHDIASRKDAVVDFKMMGIDHIFIDESHQFKNLGFSTRHDRVAGLGDSEGSQRAYNLLMAIRTIQKRTGRDLGATFLSGTTVTNSLTELYSLFRYLRPKALAAQQITCFDAWAAIFTKKSQEFEFGLTNEIVLKERFRYFIKVPELAQFYNEITDFRTAEDVGIERPDKHTMLLNIKPTPDQEEFIQRLKSFAQSGDFTLFGIFGATDKQKMAKMLYATDYARKMSLDMRLINEGYCDHPGNKASKCAQLLKRYYDKYDSVKGTQLVFSDLSSYDPKKWNVYSEIKRKLVEDYGIPAEEIRFIQECKCESKKEALIKQVNEGRVRILFGSTQMLGTGVNAQKRIVAVHHLDTPWRPSDLEQRDGRAIRKGNEIARDYADNKVDIIIYAVERSLDSYKFNLLHCKQTFIQQLKRGQLAKRTLDEGSIDEKSGMNFSEYMAILSGNTDLLERAKLEKRIVALEGERKNFFREQREQEAKIRSLMQTNERYRQHISDAEGDWRKFTKVAGTEPVNTVTLDGFTVPGGFAAGTDDYDKAVGERLLQIDNTARTQGVHLAVGNIHGFRCMVKTTEHIRHDENGNEFVEYSNQFYVEGNHLYYSHNDGYLNHASPRISGQTFLLALQRIPKSIKDWKHHVADNEATISQLRQIADRQWPKESSLRNLKADLAKLDRKINSELHKDEKVDEQRKAA